MGFINELILNSLNKVYYKSDRCRRPVLLCLQSKQFSELLSYSAFSVISIKTVLKCLTAGYVA